MAATKRTARKSTKTTKLAPTAKKVLAKAPVAKPALTEKKSPMPPRASIWGAARELIKAGKTNADVLAMLREEHSSYARWYRACLVNRKFAKAPAERAGPEAAPAKA